MTAAWDRTPAQVVAGSLLRYPLYPRLGAVIAYRAASWCWHHHLRPLALWLEASAVRSSGAEIHPAARLGPGFAILHTVGIVIGHEVVAGSGLAVYQGVTLGHTGNGGRSAAHRRRRPDRGGGQGARPGHRRRRCLDRGQRGGARRRRPGCGGHRRVVRLTLWAIRAAVLAHQPTTSRPSSLKVRPPAVHCSGGIRADGTTVIDPWAYGRWKPTTTVRDPPRARVKGAAISQVGPSPPSRSADPRR